MSQQSEFGYIESAQRLAQIGGRRWNQLQLRKAAEAGELRNTGWPIGLVVSQGDCAPVPVPDGIEARLAVYGGHDWRDFWSFNTDGGYYVVRRFEEDFGQPSFTSSMGHPDKAIWFDIRIWRIAEVILHSASLYRELGIDPDEPYLLTLNHGGLSGREFYVSDLNRFVMRGRFSRTPSVSWAKEVTLDYVNTNLKELVAEVSADLFVLFDFMEINRLIIDEIVDKFLGTKR